MQIEMKVTRVTTRVETIQHRGGPDTQQGFEDVELEAVSGTLFQGSAAGSMRFTIDAPSALGKLREGSICRVTIS